MDGFSKAWEITNDWAYVGLALLLALGVRVVHTLLAAMKFADDDKAKRGAAAFGWWKTARWIFCGGLPRRGQIPPNYWYSFVIGLAEVLSYPVLMATEAYTAIGAWIGLKTIAQWKVWADERTIFNLFLIGNLLSIFAAYILSSAGFVIARG